MSAVNVSLPQQPPETYPEPRPSEPSMEDILASIRRIIADDQSRNAAAMATFRRPSVSAPVVAPAPAATVSPEAAPAVEPPTAAAAQADAVSATVPETDIEAVATPAVVSMPATFEMLDLPTAAEPEPAETQSFSIASVSDPQGPELIDQIASAAVASILRPRFNTAPPATDDRKAPQEASSLQPVEPEPEAEVETPHPDVGEVHDDGVWLADYEVEPLVSPQTGATVESSLQALATSVFLQNTDQVEHMLRDMLRPMLKTWLDDNLPPIVERLVRIEIERVARGGRSNI